MSDRKKKDTTLRERTNPKQTVLTSWQRTTSSMCALVRVAEGEVSTWIGMTFCTLRLCGWDPTLGTALDFHPVPVRIPDTFQNPKTDRLPAPSCQMLSYFCCYCKALAPTKIQDLEYSQRVRCNFLCSHLFPSSAYISVCLVCVLVTCESVSISFILTICRPCIM